VLQRPTGLNGTQCVPDGALVCTSTHLVDGKDLVVREKSPGRSEVTRYVRIVETSHYLHWIVARITTFQLLKRYFSSPIDQHYEPSIRLASESDPILHGRSRSAEARRAASGLASRWEPANIGLSEVVVVIYSVCGAGCRS
jgi:hypothetical protein